MNRWTENAETVGITGIEAVQDEILSWTYLEPLTPKVSVYAGLRVKSSWTATTFVRYAQKITQILCIVSIDNVRQK